MTPTYRWASFRQAIDDIDKSVKSILSGDQNVKFLHHVGGTYYVSVNSGQWRSQKFSMGGVERQGAEGARIEAPKAPRGVGCGEGVSPSGEGDTPVPHCP